MRAPLAEPATAAAKILVIDDERGMRDWLTYELGERGYSVVAVASGAEALEALKAKDFGLAISDIRMPGMDGLSLLREIKRVDPDVEVVLSTGYGTVENAVVAMKEGAFDFLLKPVGTEELAAVTRRALRAGELKATLALYESSLALFRSLELSEVLPRIADLARRLLDADRTAILLPEGDGLRVAAASPAAPAGQPPSALLAAACARARSSDLGFAEVPAQVPELAAEAGGVRALLAQPLAAGGRTLGFLTAVRTERPEPFSTPDLRRAAVFAGQAAQAARNAELFHELGETQNRLLQSEKLSALGRVAAGIAHEINNPLTVVLSSLELVLTSETLDEQARQDVECAMAEARHCGDIVRDLLEFVRKRAPRKESVELLPLLESSLTLARLGVPRVPRLIRRCPARSPRVEADPVQLKQVFVNLARNACQAMEACEDPALTLAVEESAGRVFVRLEDCGGGIAPENAAKLFEPFFTTKAPGKGTGLGLYLCRLLVERNGGHIGAGNREEGGGAVFTVALPATP